MGGAVFFVTADVATAVPPRRDKADAAQRENMVAVDDDDVKLLKGQMR